MCISFDGNGLTFNGEATNDASYISTPIVDERIEHSNSVYTEEGVYNGYATYGGNDVVTIKGATSLHIKVTYGIPQGASSGPPSYLYIWEGNHPDYANYNSNAALRQCGDVTADFYSNGSPGSQLTMECDILGDSVTFYDYSNYGVSTGYYATVSANVNAFSRQNIAGAYAVPEGSDASFLGWSFSRTTPGEGSVADVEYANGSEVLYLMPGNNSETKKLYAVWKSSKNFANSSTLQEINDCPASLPTERVYTLTDTRDGQDYKVAKLKDGKCWMVENLNLAGGTALSADNTDVTSEYIASYIAGDSRLAKSGDTLVLPASNTAGFNIDNYSYVYNSVNTTNCGASGQDAPCYSYYSWDAATLGSGRTIATENTDAPYSICPKGWRLPTSGNSSNNGWKRGDFYKLATAYGANLESNDYEFSSTFYNNAGPNTTVPKFLLAGYYYHSLFYGGGSYGDYWSSTSYSDNPRALILNLTSSYVGSALTFNRRNGFSVRCLFSGQ